MPHIAPLENAQALLHFANLCEDGSNALSSAFDTSKVSSQNLLIPNEINGMFPI